ncbi:hypothetical protein MFLAVUS_005047 [Mucor flavus]|uniref:rRNA-processing protein EFG1 n=1 Tax=Mucor flavus TaxID=439312 RepID=A0ABP9YXP1_9FUNG
MKTQPQQQYGKPKSTFVRTRNQTEDIPLSASKIKKRIRDVKRTLAKGKNVSAQVITESKRRLRALELELGEKVIDEAERSHATKYHMVKHFERKKLERKVKQAKAALAGESDETKKARLQDKLDEQEIKLLYVLHYPKTIPYVSLFAEENEDDIKSKARREGLLKEIKESLLNGDKDLKLLNKKYREIYKQKLIKRGDLKPEEPIDEGADVIMEDKKKEDVEDDFFEK